MVLFGIGAAAVLATAFSYVNKGGTFKPASNVNSTPPVEIATSDDLIVSSEVAQNDMSQEWRTYTNTKDGYAFSFPGDWLERPHSPLPENARQLVSFVKYRSPHTIHVEFHANPENLTLHDYVSINVIYNANIRYKEVGSAASGMQDAIWRGISVINGTVIEAVSGAHLPASADSLHLYVTIESGILEFVLWPKASAEPQTEVDKDAQEILYRMAASARPFPASVRKAN